MMPQIPAELKPGVSKYIAPEALFWFRWGAMGTIFFGIVLLVGWLRGKAFLQWALEAAFEGLDEEGWLKLSRNWGFFFFVLAALNEGLRHFFNAANGNFGVWVSLKLWVFMPLSFLFTFTQLPMLLRHGLMAEAEDEVIENPPPE